jgi:hypothetical protein
VLLHFSCQTGIEVFHYYFEPGHTQMKADGVHSAIEKLKSKKPALFVPKDLVSVIAGARLSQPYTIHILNHASFKKFDGLLKLQGYPNAKPPNATVLDVKGLCWLLIPRCLLKILFCSLQVFY